MFIGRKPEPNWAPIPGDAYDVFCRLRQLTVAAFSAWLAEQPTCEAVQLELDASVSMLRQIAALDALQRAQPQPNVSVEGVQ